MSRRGVFFALILTLASFGCSDQIVAPEVPSVAEVEGVVPLMSHGTGDVALLGTTNKGNLVRIDIEGTPANAVATLIGDSGEDPSGLFDVGWTGLAFGPPLAGSGAERVLYTLSRASEDPRRDGCVPSGFLGSTACVHMFSVDPADGSIIEDHGIIFSGGNPLNGSTRVSDLDFDGARWGALRRLFRLGAFAVIDKEDDGDFVYNPRFTNAGLGKKLSQGGLSYHPVTGEWWAVEAWV